MSRASKAELTHREMLIVELVHFLAYGDEAHLGLNLKETFDFLTKKIRSKDGRNALECLDQEHRKFINELKTFVDSD